MFKQTTIGFHPLENIATTVIASQDLIKLVDACMNEFSVVDFNEINTSL